MKKDYLWERGCCLTCNSPQKEKKCWCDWVACRDCIWYNGDVVYLEGEKEYFIGEKGKCELPSSKFGYDKQIGIRTTTEKAYLIEVKDYNPFWLPRKGTIIESYYDEREKKTDRYFSIQGWLLLMKIKEFGNDELGDFFLNIYYNGLL